MDPYERYYRRSLRDVLVGQGVLSQEKADELVESAYESNEPFGAVVVDAGHLTSWDLVKAVCTHYQMPVLRLGGYDFASEMFEVISPATLYHHQLVPVGRFGKSWAFAVIEPPTRECVEMLKQTCGPSLFFFASEVPEVQAALQEYVKVVDVSSDKSWESVFDTGDAAVLDQLTSPE